MTPAATGARSSGSGPVLIWVQHLLGSGHLRRAALLAKACAEAGLPTRLISGGMPVPGIDAGAAGLVQLEPVRCAPDDFSNLLDGKGDPIDDAFRKRRRERLIAEFAAARPETLILEMFPFGRRQMVFELAPLIARARAAAARPRIVASVRDILQTGRKPSRLEEAARLLEASFDLVLVHGDPRFARLEETFPPAARIREKLAYTGYIAPPSPNRNSPVESRREVVVAAGGGAVGEALLAAAIAARAQVRTPGLTWRLLAGHGMAQPAFEALRARAGPGLVIERNREDYLALLAGAAVSVSQGGYNTVADILSAGARAVIVPFAAGGETEQTFRAARLSRIGRAVMVAENDLSPARLAAAIDGALNGAPPKAVPIDLDGAVRSVRILRGSEKGLQA